MDAPQKIPMYIDTRKFMEWLLDASRDASGIPLRRRDPEDPERERGSDS